MSLRSPRGHGFMPIDSNTMDDIPLNKMRSNASTIGVGARRADQTAAQGIDMAASGEKPANASNPGLAGRRRVQKELKRSGSNLSEPPELKFMGRFYRKITGYSPLTKYGFFILPVAFVLAIPLAALPLTGNLDKDRVSLGGKEGSRVSLFWLFVWLEISWFSLWIGKLVAHLLPRVFMFFSGVVSSGTRKYATVIRALEVPLSLFFWGLASWLAFKFMFTDDAIEWVKVVKRILLSLFLSSAVLLGEKAFVQLISISYHQRSFANRIHDSKHEIALLGLMYETSRTLFPMHGPTFSEEDLVINDSIDMLLTGGNLKITSAKPMRLVGKAGRLGDKLTSVVGNIASEITGKKIFNPNAAHSVVIQALEKVRSSEALARRIWMSFVAIGSDTLLQQDIIDVLGPAQREEAEECFNTIDADQNGDISIDEMVRKVVEIGKERKAIASSMKDIGQALRVFDKVLLFVVLIIVIIIFLAVFQSSFIATLTTAGTTLLSLSFVFAVTTQEFLGSCIFLFVKHPYDVGDRVDIQGPEKQQMIVEKISLLYTVFTRIDKMQVVQVPNIQLNNLWIENVTRSKAMKEVIDVNVSFDTTFEEIELLRLEMEKFVRAPENNRDFQPDVAISVGGVGDLDKLTLKVAIKHKSNWHNEMVRATRRSKFMCALTLALKLVPINGPGGGGDALGGPANPQYAVAVSDDFAAQAREKSEKEKAAKKLANKKDEDNNKDAEQRAAENLNATDPVSEALEDWGYEDTLTSRAPSTRRANNGETTRRDGLDPRDSQRGRRRPGDTLPATFGEGPPADLHMTPASSRGTTSFDIESQAGLAGPSTTPSMAQYASTAGPAGLTHSLSMAQGGQQQPGGVFQGPPGQGGQQQPGGVFQGPPGYAPPTTGLSNLTVQTEPQQPMQRVSGSLGARPRGASASGGAVAPGPSAGPSAGPMPPPGPGPSRR